MSSNSSDDEESEFKYVPPECIFVKSEPADAEDTDARDKADLIPEKSRESYWGVYDAFEKWKNKTNVDIISENVMLDYFGELSRDYKPSSLWCKYSMLRSTIEVKHNVKIAHFKKLLAFLKEKNKGYEPKKSKVLTPDNVKTFLNNAPDDIYLTTKITLIFCLFGNCRNCELVNLTVNNVIDHGQIIQVKLTDSKTKAIRTFIIEGEPANQIRAYRALRPKNAITDRFFLQIRKGVCTNQPLGKNKFGCMPKEVAEFLKLPDSESYSGLAFRRSSGALSTDRDVTMTDLRSLGGWEPAMVAEGYIDQPTFCKDYRMRTYSKQVNNVIAETSNMREDVTIEEYKDPLYLQKGVQYHEKAAHVKEDVHKRILQELEIMLSTVDAECTLEKLKKDKAYFAIKLTELQLQNKADNDDTRNQEQITELMKNFELTNIQIKKLEQQIKDSDEENKAKTRWDFVSTVTDAKEALNSLWEIMASNRKEFNSLKNNLMEKNEKLKNEKDSLQMQCKSYKELLDNLHKSPKAKRKAVSSLLVTEFF